MLKSVHVLAGAMEDIDPAVRLRAAGSTLHLALKAIDIKELEKRLERLDDAFSFWAKGEPRR